MIMIRSRPRPHRRWIEASAPRGLRLGALVGSSPDSGSQARTPADVVARCRTIFFATAGLRIDLTEPVQPVLVAGFVVLASRSSPPSSPAAYLGASIARRSRSEALAAGPRLRGVIEVIIAMVGLRLRRAPRRPTRSSSSSRSDLDDGAPCSASRLARSHRHRGGVRPRGVLRALQAPAGECVTNAKASNSARQHRPLILVVATGMRHYRNTVALDRHRIPRPPSS